MENSKKIFDIGDTVFCLTTELKKYSKLNYTKLYPEPKRIQELKCFGVIQKKEMLPNGTTSITYKYLVGTNASYTQGVNPNLVFNTRKDATSYKKAYYKEHFFENPLAVVNNCFNKLHVLKTGLLNFVKLERLPKNPSWRPLDICRYIQP